jgi:cyanophycinase
MGEEHFRLLGAEAIGLAVIDRASADDPDNADRVETADLVYFSGGDPHFLHETLRGSRVWQAVQNARQRGAVLAGCSAGAMILASEIPDFRKAGLTSRPAFGLLPARLILPHFDRWRFFQAAMLGTLRHRLREGEFALGIDEQTALIGRLGEPEWAVRGRQTVTKLTREGTTVYRSGESVPMNGG